MVWRSPAGYQKVRADLTEELAHELYRLTREGRPLPSKSLTARRAERAAITPPEPSAAISDLVTELNQLCDGYGVTVRKIRSDGHVLQSLLATDHELNASILGDESDDRAPAAYRVLDCCSDSGVASHRHLVLRSFLNFSEYAEDLPRRRERVEVALKQTPDEVSAFAASVFESFAVDLAHSATSRCRRGGGAEAPTSPQAPDGPSLGLRQRIGLVTVEVRPEHHTRLTIDILGQFPAAEAILREVVSPWVGPEGQYEQLVNRVVVSRWGREPDTPASPTDWGELPADAAPRDLVRFMLGTSPSMGIRTQGFNEVKTALQIGARWTFDYWADDQPTWDITHNYLMLTSRVLDRFCDLLHEIDEAEEWEVVLRPGRSPDNAGVLQPA